MTLNVRLPVAAGAQQSRRPVAAHGRSDDLRAAALKALDGARAVGDARISRGAAVPCQDGPGCVRHGADPDDELEFGPPIRALGEQFDPGRPAAELTRRGREPRLDAVLSLADHSQTASD
jgi:hypothetical protein